MATTILLFASVILSLSHVILLESAITPINKDENYDTPESTTSLLPTMQPNATKQARGRKINATLLSLTYDSVMKNYDSKFRPEFGDNATEVELDINVLSFSEIDESAMEYGIDFYFAQFWHDPRLINTFTDMHPDHSYINLIGKEVESLWLPDTVFINSKFSKFHDVTVNNRFLTINFTNGKVIYHARISTTASCRMDLRDYPFDYQTCFLAIESYGHDQTDMKYKWYDFTNMNCTGQCKNIMVYDKEMSNFDVVEAIKSKKKTTYHAINFSSATAKFTFRRRANYFVLQVYLPCILIVMVTWTSFWITPTAVPARSAICVTTILTLITMLGIVNVNMPKVSYIKALDMYLFVSFVFVLMSLFEYIIVLNFTWSCFQKKKNECSSPEISQSKLQMIFKGGSVKHIDNCNEEWYESNGISNNKHKHLVNGNLENGFNNSRMRKNVWTRNDSQRESIVDIDNNRSNNNNNSNNTNQTKELYSGKSNANCDIISRFLFPICFMCFNIGYWTTYIIQHKHYEPMA